MAKGTLRICEKGHSYYKSSDCPVCPVCEQEKKPQSGFLSRLGAPARRALANAGIDSPEKLALHTEKEILTLHGMGPSSLPVLRAVLKESNLAFRTGS
ncbi:RNA polymerase alpha subunit C-terminal domain-containing protein [Niabella beijingensis]|uniref:RNA polymerase alpha subunit C-terminal domain-containing protein n=1 Tax=Niabella beijingensis TaxID=2872700 RepID=UPI001CC0837C|nr:RNA polymerase alpha subunit C-terminal domain-containing protein [Niabella beijingensis]